MSGPLIERIHAAVAANPAAPAFIFHDSILSYAQFLTLIHATTRLLHDRGIRPGDTVGLSMGRWPMHCVAFLALARLGALALPLPRNLGPEAGRVLAARFGVSTVVSNWENAPVPPGARLVLLDSMSLSGAVVEPGLGGYQPDGSTPLRIALTSGTTGERRGVVHTHASFMQRVDLTALDCDRHSRLLPPDLHITAGILLTIAVLTRGGTVVFDRTFSVTDIVNTIRLYGVTHCLLSPAAVPRIAAVLPEQGLAFPSLRHLRIVGATPPPAMVGLLRSRFTPHAHGVYGITEVGMLALATPELLSAVPGCAGRITPWTRVEVLGPDGQPVPPGESGELRVATDGMPREYYREPPGAAPSRFRDGWFYPGDVGRVTADGLVFVEGRADDIVNLGGHKYALPLIDAGIESHPAVRAAVAFTLEDTDGNVMVGAAIEREPGPTAPGLEEIAAWIRRQLRITVAMRLFEVPGLAHDDMGKINRDAVRMRVADRTG
jgi:fatty-acyl-CoA synthase/O-succinylbenzoic acid--CoA ligase